MKDIPLIYQDDDLLVVNKPAGLAVQGGSGITVCLLDILERQLDRKVFPVHRLDRDTAGLMAVALNSKTAAAYTQYISGNSVKKVYRAVCSGVPSAFSGTIDALAGRADDRKPATTAYRVVVSSSDYSLLSLELGTGRMHQIRIHLASIGCPILGDDKYGDFKKNRAVRSQFGIRKLQLAACELALPINGIKRLFTADLPDHMTACLEALALTGPGSES